MASKFSGAAFAAAIVSAAAGWLTGSLVIALLWAMFAATDTPPASINLLTAIVTVLPYTGLITGAILLIFLADMMWKRVP